MNLPMPSAPRCVNHPGEPAVWYCPRCEQPVCAACVRGADAARGREVVACVRCGLPLQRIDTEPLPAHLFEDPRPFLPRVIEAPLYPLRGSGWAVLIGAVAMTVALMVLGGAVAWAPAVYRLPLGLFLVIVVPLAVYMSAYLLRIIRDSALGERQLPDWPDIAEMWDDIVRPNLLLIGVLGVCFGPGLAWRWFAAEPAWAAYALLAAGLVYLPMALLATVVHDSVLAANPVTVLLAVARAPIHYLIMLGAFSLLYGVAAGGAALLDRAPLAAGVATSAVGLYLLMIDMHLLGQLYHANRFTLRWVHRPEIRPLDEGDAAGPAPAAHLPPRGPIDLG